MKVEVEIKRGERMSLKGIPRSVDERSLGALGLLVDDASLGNEDNIRAAEFLLELVDDLGLNPVCSEREEKFNEFPSRKKGG